MKTIQLLFPHQLFERLPFEKHVPIYLVEEWLFFRQYRFHKQKITFHRASMQYYAESLRSEGYTLTYINATEDIADIRALLPSIKREEFQHVRWIDPVDFLLQKRLKTACSALGMTMQEDRSPAFLNSPAMLKDFFKPSKKKFFQTSFYQSERKRMGILIDPNGDPTGKQWSFDADNRKKYPKKKSVPPIQFPSISAHYEEAIRYINTHFNDHYGVLSSTPRYPIDRPSALQWLTDFFEERFAEFGDFEDAIVQNEVILHHSVLSPLINVGILSPEEVVHKALSIAEEKQIPLNSLEGFVRQIIGWREFVRGMYGCKGVEMRTTNFWGFTRKIPSSFYDGTTGIPPVDHTIKKLLETGYTHHIERLMVLGNFMLLCEFDPDEVYQWFMELYIDSYDWVMVPNVYGMSQFADGGFMTTKPYISGSNYLRKMSDYPSGDWEEVWDALFWRFMHVHRSFFLTNPRLGMLIGNFDKMSGEKRSKLLEIADDFLAQLPV